MNPLLPVLTILISYLIGAIPFGYLVAWVRGVDITKLGSGNIGATNVGRVLGKRLGILVFVLDFAKGALPAAGARWWTSDGSDWLPVFAGLSAVLGHMFPVYLRFRGGKGVATGAGVVMMLLPWPALGGLLAWVAVLCASRYVSLASLTAAGLLCLLRLVLEKEPFHRDHMVLTGFCFLAAGLVFARHHANIKRLLRGSENQIQDTPAMLTLTKTIHVLALGLWFGTLVFFTFAVGLQLLATFDQLTIPPARERPFWLPVPAELERDQPGFPEPLRKEQGRRLFGAAVGPLFLWYFGIQTVCGILALATAWPWRKVFPEKVHRWRGLLLAIAVGLVGISWWLDYEVHQRRDVRSTTSDAVLRSPDPVPPDWILRAGVARADFDRWHTFSLLVNFATLMLVAVATALAAQLPTAVVPAPIPKD